MSHNQDLKDDDLTARRETMEEADVLLIGGGVMLSLIHI